MSTFYSFYGLLGRIAYYCSAPLRWLFLGRRVRAYAAIVYDSRILLVKNWLGDGSWSLPGGGTHTQELASDAVIREVHEELGVHLEKRYLTFLREGFHKGRVGGKHYALFRYDLHHVPTIHKRWSEILQIQWVPLTSVQSVDKITYEVERAVEQHQPVD